MIETVSVNGLTLCHKNSTGWVRSTLPDVCKSPGDPVPYDNVAFAKDLADGTTTVFSNGGAMCGVLGSRFAVSIGDEPGTGGGVTSQVFIDEATFLAWSPDVLLPGRPAGRRRASPTRCCSTRAHHQRRRLIYRPGERSGQR